MTDDPMFRAGVERLQEALRSVPIPGSGEEMMEFRDRQDRWLAGAYRAALSPHSDMGDTGHE